MGCCCGTGRHLIPIRVPVPEHGSGFWNWGEHNCLVATKLLLSWYDAASSREKRKYQQPYCVYPPDVVTLVGMGGTNITALPTNHVACVVTDTVAELHNCALLLHSRLQKVGAKHQPYRYDPTLQYAQDMDIRRVHAALYVHLPLLVEASRAKKVIFTATLDTAWLNEHIPNRFTLTHGHCKKLVKLFNKINRNRTGGLTVKEFVAWVAKNTRGDAEAESVFLDFVFLVNGRTRSPGVLDVHEFILVVHTFLTLSHEEMIEHCFSCMADTITEGGHLAVNMRKIVKRYPKLARANRVQHAGNEMLVTEFTNLAEARNIMIQRHLGKTEQPAKVTAKYRRGNLIRNPFRDKRFTAPLSKGFDPRQPLERHTLEQEGQLCTRAQFLELCTESTYIMGPMYMLQSMMHQKIFGVHFWEQRAYVIRAENGGKSRPRTKFLTRSISRQLLHSQNSGVLRVCRPNAKQLREAPLHQAPMDGTAAKSPAPMPSAPPPKDGSKATATPPSGAAPAVEEAKGDAKDGDTAGDGGDTAGDGSGGGGDGGGDGDGDGDARVSSQGSSGGAGGLAAPQFQSARLPGSPEPNEAMATPTALRHPIGIGPHDHPAPPRGVPPHSTFLGLTWVHQVDDTFALLEAPLGDDHEPGDDDVEAALTAMDHDHSQLDAVRGMEPLMQLGSMMSTSHFPPMNPGMRQRRHTFHSFAHFGATTTPIPPAVHTTPTNRMRQVASEGHMAKGAAQREKRQRRRSSGVKRAQRVGVPRKYDTGGNGEYVYPAGWSSSRLEHVAGGGGGGGASATGTPLTQASSTSSRQHRPYFPPRASAPPVPESYYAKTAVAGGGGGGGVSGGVAAARQPPTPSAPPPKGDDPFAGVYGHAVGQGGAGVPVTEYGGVEEHKGDDYA